jgi:hypothetical protein
MMAIAIFTNDLNRGINIACVSNKMYEKELR